LFPIGWKCCSFRYPIMTGEAVAFIIPTTASWAWIYATSALKDYIWDSLYTIRISNYRVVCPKKILGIGQRQSELAIEDARLLADLWGEDPVHPANSAYKVIAEGILKDISCAQEQGSEGGQCSARLEPSKRPLGQRLHSRSAAPRRAGVRPGEPLEGEDP
jgi:hypothetical protein